MFMPILRKTLLFKGFSKLLEGGVAVYLTSETNLKACIKFIMSYLPDRDGSGIQGNHSL